MSNLFNITWLNGLFLGLFIGAGAALLYVRFAREGDFSFTKLIDLIGSGFRFYINLIFFGAFLYAMYLLVTDVVSPGPPPASDTTVVERPAQAAWP